MIEIGALWKKEGEKGPFLAGQLNNASIMIFPNTQKNAANQPDYRIMIAEGQKRQGQGQRRGGGGNYQNNQRPQQQANRAPQGRPAQSPPQDAWPPDHDPEPEF